MPGQTTHSGLTEPGADRTRDNTNAAVLKPGETDIVRMNVSG